MVHSLDTMIAVNFFFKFEKHSVDPYLDHFFQTLTSETMFEHVYLKNC